MTDFGRRSEHGAAQNTPDTGDARTDWGGRYATLREPRQPNVAPVAPLGLGRHAINILKSVITLGRG